MNVIETLERAFLWGDNLGNTFKGPRWMLYPLSWIVHTAWVLGGIMIGYVLSKLFALLLYFPLGGWVNLTPVFVVWAAGCGSGVFMWREWKQRTNRAPVVDKVMDFALPTAVSIYISLQYVQ